MPTFVEFQNNHTQQTMSINIEHITFINPYTTDLTIVGVQGKEFTVKSTYDQVCTAITQAHR